MTAASPTQPRIDPTNVQDLSFWADRLAVPADELRNAVMLVGNDAEAVELALKGAVTACRPH